MITHKSTDLELLLACKIVAENFAAHYQELGIINPSYTKDSVNHLFNRVDRAFNYYLGLETSRETEHSRNKLNHIQAQALRAVAFLKTRIEVIYALDSKRKNKVLNKLGFKDYLKAIQEKDTEMLLKLLGNIKKNLTTEIKGELIKNESDRNFIDRISQFAIKLQKANQSQTSLMATKKAIADQATEVYNELLLDILEICKDATELYKDKPEKARLFDYSVIVRKTLISEISLP